MKSRPILFSGPMVRALLAGTKTQTRRIVKPSVKGCTVGAYSEKGRIEPVNVDEDGGPWDTIKCPYSVPGDRLWVRETWGYAAQCDDINGPGDVIAYRAGGEHVYEDVAGKRRLRRIKDGWVMCPNHFCWPPKPWKPSIFMPRWASRITLEITNVRVERLQEISESDAVAEGCEYVDDGTSMWAIPGLPETADWSAKYCYSKLWESINGPGSWALNPWVWVIEFKRVEGGK